MNYDENTAEINLLESMGLRLVEDLNPDSIREKMIDFINTCADVVTEYVDREGSVDLIFPMNGGAMFMYLLRQRLPLVYVDKINWVSAYRPNKFDKKKFKFVHSKGDFVGKPIIIDDMWDTGATSEFISDEISSTLGSESTEILNAAYVEDGRYKESKGAMKIPVLAATTKDGKGFNSAVHSYKKFNDEDDWIASAFSLDCGKGDNEISLDERMSGVSFSVVNLKKYMEGVQDTYVKAWYQSMLRATGEECYREYYLPMRSILEILDNEGMDLDLRNLAVQIELGLISE